MGASESCERNCAVEFLQDKEPRKNRIKNCSEILVCIDILHIQMKRELRVFLFHIDRTVDLDSSSVDTEI